jgi:hypothetical protein
MNRMKKLLAAVLPLAVMGVVLAGPDCMHGKAEGKTAEAGYGSHCKMNKDVVKEAKLTDDGAIITLKGKNKEATENIKTHLAAHTKGEGCCPECPLSMKDVKADFQVNDEGGVITVKALNPEAVKAVQEWANRKGGCCAGKGQGTKA